MNTFKNRLFGVALVAFGMMSFTMMPVDPDPVDEMALAKNGEWINAGQEFINGVLYNVKECVAGSATKCVIGSKTYKKKKFQTVPM